MLEPQAVYLSWQFTRQTDREQGYLRQLMDIAWRQGGIQTDLFCARWEPDGDSMAFRMEASNGAGWVQVWP